VKIKRRLAPFAFLLLPVFFFASGCSSLPSLPDAEIRVEDESPADAEDTEVVPAPETALDAEPEAAEEEDGPPEIWIRPEETLAYLNSPLNLDLPEPEYMLPEPELAEAEPPLPADEPPEPVASTASAEPVEPTESTESTESIEPTEPIEPAAAVADGAEGGDGDAAPPEDVAAAVADGAEGGDGDAAPPEEVAEEEPPPVPPAILRPVREIAAAPPRREPVPVPPSPLPVLPARVPSTETKPQNEAAAPTRTVQATLGENAEVPLPGSGWVYLGEADNQSGLAYRQRRASAEGQIFVFRPESAGSYWLKFKKQDLLRGTETNEIVEVAVAERNTPEEPAVVPATVPAIAAADTPPAATEPVSPESPPPMVAAASTAPPAAAAPAVPDDAALWNRGQELEAPGPNRDMKGALAAYKALVQDYPQSEYYTGSQRRIAFIERFFVNIR
jgi:hypothetical protein